MTGPMSTMCDESTPHSSIWDSPGRCLTRPTQIHWQENMRRADIRGLGSIVWMCRMHKYSRPGGITCFRERITGSNRGNFLRFGFRLSWFPSPVGIATCERQCHHLHGTNFENRCMPNMTIVVASAEHRPDCTAMRYGSMTTKNMFKRSRVLSLSE